MSCWVSENDVPNEIAILWLRIWGYYGIKGQSLRLISAWPILVTGDIIHVINAEAGCLYVNGLWY